MVKLGDIYLDDDICRKFLDKNGYIVETIKAKYPTGCFLSDSNGLEREYDVMNIRIAYREGERPKWADEYPSVYETSECNYEKVLESLIKAKISEFLLS